MSGSAVVAYILSQADSVTDLVPGARILAAPELPMRFPLPAINVWHISGSARLTVAMAARSKLITQRVQVMVHAGSEAAKDAIVALLEQALPVSRGQVNGVSVDSILPDLVGPDLSQPEASIYQQSQDFIVKWTTAQPHVLLEDGSALLLEDGSKVLLEG